MPRSGTSVMPSHVVRVSDTFTGAAVCTLSRLDHQFRFIAVDPCIDGLNQNMWPATRGSKSRGRAPAAHWPPDNGA